MQDSNFVNPIIVMGVKQNPDLEFALCAEFKNDVFTSVSMNVYKKSTKTLHPTTDFLMNELFQLKFNKTAKPDVYQLTLAPIPKPITVIYKNKKFIAQYLMTEQNVMGIIEHVMINAVPSPLSLEFHLTANFRKSADDVRIKLYETILCPKELTQKLYDFVM